MPKPPTYLSKDPNWTIVAGLAMPSKMPGFSYSLPSKDCVTGTKLRAVKGSTCSHCYAHNRGRYMYPTVKACLERRLESVRSDLPRWTSAMIALLEKEQRLGDLREFRWHDSGDLQSVDHLCAIVAIAEALPDVRFWLPTREYAMVRDWLLLGRSFPRNLTVRLSATLVGVEPSVRPELAARGIQTSSVGASVGAICEAKSRDNHCGPCRACWDKSIPNVDYPLH